MPTKNEDMVSKAELSPHQIIQRLTAVIALLVTVFVGTMGLSIYLNKKTADILYKNYIANTREIINSQDKIAAANSWERLPINERKEKLRSRFYEIIKYYTVAIPQNQKMSDEQMLSAFDAYYSAIYTVNSVNFFFPLAYLKVRTNYNPTFSSGYQWGIAGFFTVEAQKFANLPIVKENVNFQVAFKGRETLQNPIESLKLLIARTDDLMKTFNNREDWVILALINHDENAIIDKYWQDGKGEIPEALYKKGDLKDVLDYYYCFKDWKIPAIPDK